MAVLSWWSDFPEDFLEGQAVFSRMKLSNNRSVMPLDVQGCTRATLEESACCNHCRKVLVT
ncbi:hypothetical protein Tcan_00044, partial [Toxocara canis]